VPRETSFVITAASEVMALLGLASGLRDLRERLGRIEVAETTRGTPVTAEDLRVSGAMTVLLKDALRPNLVQTLEGQPALIHTGPFGNIATANSSILADRVAMKLGEFVVTEAGFGSELGLEKFCHLVAPSGNVRPSAAVVVATIRALKAHGGVAEGPALAEPDEVAVVRGAENLAAHLGIVRAFGLPSVVAVNRFASDTGAELSLVATLAREAGADRVVVNDGFEKGGAGAIELAEAVVEACEHEGHFAPINPPGMPIRTQIGRIATTVYGADSVDYSPQAERQLARLAERGLDELPVCMAKTHMSLSHDPSLPGRPRGFRLPIRDLRPSVGAGFVVAMCGDIMLMPGLGRAPAFAGVDVDDAGNTVGLF
jgi:formate--tetrahydrofolate ligase